VTRLLLNKKRSQRVEQFALPVDTVEPTDIAAAAN
jgi:aliphatic nitrilase